MIVPNTLFYYTLRVVIVTHCVMLIKLWKETA